MYCGLLYDEIIMLCLDFGEFDVVIVIVVDMEII